MRRSTLAAVLSIVSVLTVPSLLPGQSTFIRGDCNQDASLDIADAVFTLEFAILQIVDIPNCLDACDFNDDGGVDITDAVNTLDYLFSFGPPPTAPFPECGVDPTDDFLECEGPFRGCPMENFPPEITSRPALTAEVGVLYSYSVEASDPNAGDTLTFSLLVAPTTATIDPSTGLLTWTPDLADVGTANFVVRVTDDGDGALFDEQSWEVLVATGNEAPVITSTPVLNGTEGELYTYDVEAMDPNAGDTLTFNLQAAPAGATIDTASGLITWTPSAMQVGMNDFTVRVTDDGVGMLFDEQSWEVLVATGNEAPVITSTPVLNGTEGELYTYDVEAMDPNVGDVLTFNLQAAPAGATIDTASGLITWTPSAMQVGMNDFTVRVTDDGVGMLFDEQSWEVLVATGNEAPVITSTPVLNGTEGELYTYDVEAMDPNVGDVLTFNLQAAPAGATIDTASGLITWTPSAMQVGMNDFTVRVTDDGVGMLFDEQSWEVLVATGNEAPVITSTPVLNGTEGELYTYDVEAMDPNVGDVLTFNLQAAPAGATIDTASGLITWTPSAMQVGMNDFTVRVTDDGVGMLFDEQSWEVLVATGNEAPVITSTPVLNGTEGELYTYDVEAMDPNVGDVLTFNLQAAPAGATIDTASGLIMWTPSAMQVGMNAFTVRVTDDGVGMLFDEQSWEVLVATGNEAPVITSTPVLNGTEGELYTYDVEAMDPNAGDSLTFNLQVAPAGATIDTASGLIMWTPGAMQVGMNSFTVRVTDDGVGMLFDEQSWEVLVATGNEAPVITSTPVLNGTEGLEYTYDVEAMDPNAGDTLTFSLELAPVGAMIDAVTGLIAWTPDASQVGTNDFTVRVTDDGVGALFDEQSWQVTVDAGNLPPMFTSTPVTTATVNIGYLYDVDAEDPELGAIVYSLEVAPAGASIDSGSGEITWSPLGADVGFADFTVRAADPQGVFDEQSFVVEVRYRINCGEKLTPYTDSTGAIWSTDFGFDVGGDFATGDSILGTPDPTLYQSVRFSSMTTIYSLPVPTGITLTVRLLFAEVFFTAAGERVFDVEVEGMTFLDDYDITAVAGAFTANDQIVDVMVTDGFLEVAIIRDLADLPILNGIEVRQATMIGPMAPMITSIAPTEATVGVAYAYDVDAVDPNPGDSLTFTLEVAPAGATINPSTGLVNWNPKAGQLGSNPFTVRVTDAGGLFDEQSFTVEVELPAPQQPPIITSAPPASGTVMAVYTYDVEVVDPNPGDVVNFKLMSAPSGATIDPATGLIEWTPLDSDVGFRRFIVRASDDTGLSSDQDFGVEARYRINCGDAAAPYVDSEGNRWTVDFGFDRGGAFSVNDPIAGTPDPTLYQSLRFTFDDLFTYSLAVPSDTYRVRASFAEIFFDVPGERVWDVALEGTIVLNGYDAVVAAGAGFTADVQEFIQPITDGFVTLDLIQGLMREPTICAIEVALDNQLPTVTSLPVTSGAVGVAYFYDVEATDPNPVDFVTYSLDVAPSGATIDPVSGTIDWTPDGAQVGANSFSVRVTDGGGLGGTQDFVVDVTP